MPLLHSSVLPFKFCHLFDCLTLIVSRSFVAMLGWNGGRVYLDWGPEQNHRKISHAFQTKGVRNSKQTPCPSCINVFFIFSFQFINMLIYPPSGNLKHTFFLFLKLFLVILVPGNEDKCSMYRIYSMEEWIM